MNAAIILGRLTRDPVIKVTQGGMTIARFTLAVNRRKKVEGQPDAVETIARAYAAENILSFAITPGFTDTAMAGDYLASRGGPGLLADIPLGRVATPEEIAGIIAWCALDAPPSLTGATLDAIKANPGRLYTGLKAA